MIETILVVYYILGCLVSLAAGSKIIYLTPQARPVDYLTLMLLTTASWAGFSVIAYTIGKVSK